MATRTGTPSAGAGGATAPGRSVPFHLRLAAPLDASRSRRPSASSRTRSKRAARGRPAVRPAKSWPRCPPRRQPRRRAAEHPVRAARSTPAARPEGSRTSARKLVLPRNSAFAGAEHDVHAEVRVAWLAAKRCWFVGVCPSVAASSTLSWLTVRHRRDPRAGSASSPASTSKRAGASSTNLTHRLISTQAAGRGTLRALVNGPADVHPVRRRALARLMNFVPGARRVERRLLPAIEPRARVQRRDSRLPTRSRRASVHRARGPPTARADVLHAPRRRLASTRRRPDERDQQPQLTGSRTLALVTGGRRFLRFV